MTEWWWENDTAWSVFYVFRYLEEKYEPDLNFRCARFLDSTMVIKLYFPQRFTKVYIFPYLLDGYYPNPMDSKISMLEQSSSSRIWCKGPKTIRVKIKTNRIPLFRQHWVIRLTWKQIKFQMNCILGTLSKTNYGIIWEFFPSGGPPPPPPPFGNPLFKKKFYRLFCILDP